MKEKTIDLTKIEGEGDFPCPECGAVIAPEDESNKIYQILDAKVSKTTLESLTLECLKCKTKIKLIGF